MESAAGGQDGWGTSGNGRALNHLEVKGLVKSFAGRRLLDFIDDNLVRQILEDLAVRLPVLAVLQIKGSEQPADLDPSLDCRSRQPSSKLRVPLFDARLVRGHTREVPLAEVVEVPVERGSEFGSTLHEQSLNRAAKIVSASSARQHRHVTLVQPIRASKCQGHRADQLLHIPRER